MHDGMGSWYLELSDDEREAVSFALEQAISTERYNLSLRLGHADESGAFASARNLGTLGRLAIRLRDLGGEDDE